MTEQQKEILIQHRVVCRLGKIGIQYLSRKPRDAQGNRILKPMILNRRIRIFRKIHFLATDKIFHLHQPSTGFPAVLTLIGEVDQRMSGSARMWKQTTALPIVFETHSTGARHFILSVATQTTGSIRARINGSPATFAIRISMLNPGNVAHPVDFLVREVAGQQFVFLRQN